MLDDFNAKSQRPKAAKGRISALSFHVSVFFFAFLRLGAFALNSYGMEGAKKGILEKRTQIWDHPEGLKRISEMMTRPEELGKALVGFPVSAPKLICAGMNGNVLALAVSRGMLYAGGQFTTAGTNACAYVAMANLAGAPVPLSIISTNAAFGFTNGVVWFRRLRPVRIKRGHSDQHRPANLDSAANPSARQRSALFRRCAIPLQQPAFLPRRVVALKAGAPANPAMYR